jgi:hypothetical protein
LHTAPHVPAAMAALTHWPVSSHIWEVALLAPAHCMVPGEHAPHDPFASQSGPADVVAQATQAIPRFPQAVLLFPAAQRPLLGSQQPPLHVADALHAFEHVWLAWHA